VTGVMRKDSPGFNWPNFHSSVDMTVVEQTNPPKLGLSAVKIMLELPPQLNPPGEG
jgi:hypothetical protein